VLGGVGCAARIGPKAVTRMSHQTQDEGGDDGRRPVPQTGQLKVTPSRPASVIASMTARHPRSLAGIQRHCHFLSPHIPVER
jgi:hypothetical protein